MKNIIFLISELSSGGTQKTVLKLIKRFSKDNFYIDILTFEKITFLSEDLVIPHPRILDRRFVLEPWKEIAPEYIISGQKLSIKELYNKYLGNRFKNQKVEIINY